MMTDTNCVVVEPGICACHSVHTIRAHHHDYPEIWAQGETSIEAVGQLANQLVRALDSVSSPVLRDPLVQALADVRAYLTSLEPGVPEGSVAACDYPNCPAERISPSHDSVT